jgi:hypothetical protein
MKTDNELVLMGLRSYKDCMTKKIRLCLKEWAKESEEKDLSVTDLNKLSNDIAVYRSELAEIEGRIKKLEPVFAADDIPF